MNVNSQQHSQYIQQNQNNHVSNAGVNNRSPQAQRSSGDASAATSNQVRTGPKSLPPIPVKMQAEQTTKEFKEKLSYIEQKGAKKIIDSFNKGDSYTKSDTTYVLTEFSDEKIKANPPGMNRGRQGEYYLLIDKKNGEVTFHGDIKNSSGKNLREMKDVLKSSGEFRTQSRLEYTFFPNAFKGVNALKAFGSSIKKAFS